MATTLAEKQEQASSALGKANAVRSANAATLRHLKTMYLADGLDYAAELLRHGDMASPLGGLPVGRLLYAIRGIREAKAARLLTGAGIHDARRPLRRLTARQCHTLAYAMECAADRTRKRR